MTRERKYNDLRNNRIGETGIGETGTTRNTHYPENALFTVNFRHVQDFVKTASYNSLLCVSACGLGWHKIQ